MNQAQVLAQARKVVEATTTNLCHRALHITAHYKNDNVWVCIDRMTDAEWQSWSGQPAFVKTIYQHLATKDDGWSDIVQLAFGAHQRRQAKMILEAA